MKKIVFFCIPAHGHTNPALGVVRELVSRGHRVWFYSYEMFREKIQAAGAAFMACDEYDMERKLSAAEAAQLGNDIVLSTRVLVDTTLALDEMVCREMERLQPDCIVADSMAVWGKAIALKLGIPFVSSTTTFAFNRHSAKIIPQGMKDLLGFMKALPACNRQVGRLRKMGYPVKHILDILQNDDRTHTVVYTSAEFQPCSETFSKEYYSFVGPSVRPPESTVEKTGKKLIYISMGTVNNAMVPLYRACIEAFREEDVQVILSVGYQVDLSVFGKLPEHIQLYSHVDQIAVLEQADVFLTHCGMNSVSEALYYGVPLVMLPVTAEQKGVAARTAQLGAGLQLICQTVPEIRRAIFQVLEVKDYAESARRIASGFRRCAGAAGAADKILSICSK